MKLHLFTTFLILFLIYETNIVTSCEDDQVVSARVESCAGCKLNVLREVKAFIYDDLPNYENVEFKKILGATPDLVFLNEKEEEVERVKLDKLSRMECNKLLTDRGFKKKDDDHAEF